MSTPGVQATTMVEKGGVLSPFPAELINTIFNSAAATSRKACLALCLVASWARQIALPHLFRTILASDQVTKFSKYWAHPPYIPFDSNINAASLVKNVCMSSQGHANIVSFLDVFQNCHNITHLAVTIRCFYKLMYASSPAHITGEEPKISGPALDTNRDFHLTLLGVPAHVGDEIELFHPDASDRSPLYDQVTHVRVQTDSAGMLHQISYFSRLTHLSLPYDNPVRQIAKYLDDFTALEMFVVAGVKKPNQQTRWKRLLDWVRAMRQKDKRVFFVEVSTIGIQAEWEEEAMGGESIWDRALHHTTQLEAQVAKDGIEEPVRILSQEIDVNFS